MCLSFAHKFIEAESAELAYAAGMVLLDKDIEEANGTLVNNYVIEIPG